MTARGQARSGGISYQEVIAADAVAPLAVLQTENFTWPGEGSIDTARYHSREFAALEAERLWANVWQMACREEHLPNVGDHLVYEVANINLIVVRTAPNEIKAFHNACLHRGTTLVEGSGNAAFFKCPFHGFAWSLDGTFRGMPASWDFPHVDGPSFCLPEAAVATWGGFVFVHPGADPEPFELFSHPLSEHFAGHPLDDRYVAHHACQVVEANWKTVQEAFLEGYHISTTHPHTIRFANDFETQYDTFGPNVSRLMQAIGVPASSLIGRVPAAEIAKTVQRLLPPEDRAEVPAGLQDGDLAGLRSFLGERFRLSFSRRWRVDLSGASDAELLDSVQYHLFPNFAPWIGYSLPIAYRFRPWGDDPNLSLMEIMLLHPRPADAPSAVQTAEPHWLDIGESWTHAPGFEALGMVIDQDMSNLPRVQRGLRATKAQHVVLADYQEIRIRHYHERLDVQLGG